jgi:hypothetical protein
MHHFVSVSVGLTIPPPPIGAVVAFPTPAISGAVEDGLGSFVEESEEGTGLVPGSCAVVLATRLELLPWDLETPTPTPTPTAIMTTRTTPIMMKINLREGFFDGG